MARTLPDGMVEALAGSTVDAAVQFNIWYGGQVVVPNVPVGAWGLEWDITRQVMGQAKATVIDETATLAPWGLADPLGVAGPKLQTVFTAGGTSIPLGFQRITRSDPEETYRVLGGGLYWVPGGATIPLQADDLTYVAAGNKLMAPETAKSGGTCFSEIQRLLTGIMDVIFDPALTDVAVPAAITYKDERMDAVEDLVYKGLNAECRMTGGGQLYVYKPTTAPVWTVNPGAEGQFIRVQRTLLVDKLYNITVSTNTTDAGAEIQGIAQETSGPLRVDGEHGRWPYRRQAPFAQTQAAIDADAATTQRNNIAGRTAIIPVQTTINPAIETGDWVTLNMPLVTGEIAAINGKVLNMALTGDGAGITDMKLKVQVPSADMQAISAKIRNSSWLAQ